MTTIVHTLMGETVARMRAGPALVPDAANIRRDHRTRIPRDAAPAIHVIDGSDIKKEEKDRGCVERHKAFTVAIFVRDDAGFAAADPIMIGVLARLNPSGLAYSRKARLIPGNVTFDQEIADGDALRVDMEFEWIYHAPQWALDQEA